MGKFGSSKGSRETTTYLDRLGLPSTGVLTSAMSGRAQAKRAREGARSEATSRRLLVIKVGGVLLSLRSSLLSFALRPISPPSLDDTLPKTIALYRFCIKSLSPVAKSWGNREAAVLVLAHIKRPPVAESILWHGFTLPRASSVAV